MAQPVVLWSLRSLDGHIADCLLLALFVGGYQLRVTNPTDHVASIPLVLFSTKRPQSVPPPSCPMS